MRLATRTGADGVIRGPARVAATLTSRRLLLIFTGFALLTGAPTAAAATAVDSLRLDAYSSHLAPDTPAVASRTRLDRGGLYVATVQGTLSFYAAIDYLDPQRPFERVCGHPGTAPLFSSAGGSGEVGEDPQFIFAYPSAKPCSGPRLPHVWSNFQADLGAGWEHPPLAAAKPLTRPTPDHLYNYGLVGRGQPVDFRLVDPDTRDDYGTLEISLRRATSSDCAGAGYQAFGLSSSAVCERMASGPRPSPLPPVHRLSIDQTPLLQVLRNRDVSSATNQELPSGVLDADQFAGLDAADPPGLGALTTDGFVSGAVSEYRGGGLPRLTSTAVRYRSRSSALAGLRSEARLARLRVPPGATVTVSGGATVTSPEIVTFTPAVASDSGGDELLVRIGSLVDSLAAVETPDRVSLAAEEALLEKVVSRRSVIKYRLAELR